jgi:hypothetical protein
MLKDLIQKIIIVLSLEYLIFFSAEVVLPGVVASAFNINILLLGILFLIGLLILLPEARNSKNDGIGGQEKLKKYGKKFLLLSGILLFVNIIALYKVSIAMIVVYTIIIIVSVKLLWNNKLSSK